MLYFCLNKIRNYEFIKQYYQHYSSPLGTLRVSYAVVWFDNKNIAKAFLT